MTATASTQTACWITSLRAALAAGLPAAVALRRALTPNPSSATRAAHRRPGGAALGQPGAADVSGGRLIKIGDGHGPVIAVRAELDALPITEDTRVPWAAGNGAAHACGHDVHLAALVALARALRGPRGRCRCSRCCSPGRRPTRAAPGPVGSAALTRHHVLA